MKVLVIEDDLSLNETIKKYLSKEGYEVLSCYNTECAKKVLSQQKIDLLLLDVKLPGESGFEFLEHNLLPPTIFITSLDSVEEVDRGFKAGAIEYIKKPFYLKELKLRIEALFKKRVLQTCGDLALDPTRLELIINNKAHRLTAKEFEIIKHLFTHPNQIINRHDLMEALNLSELALRTHIKNLRKILQDRIQTVKGEGYKLVCQ